MLDKDRIQEPQVYTDNSVNSSKERSCRQVAADNHMFSEPRIPVVSQVKYAQSAEALHQVGHLLQLTASNVEPLQAGEACYASRKRPLRLLGCPQQVVLQIKGLQSAQSAQHLQNQQFSHTAALAEDCRVSNCVEQQH